MRHYTESFIIIRELLPVNDLTNKPGNILKTYFPGECPENIEDLCETLASYFYLYAVEISYNSPNGTSGATTIFPKGA